MILDALGQVARVLQRLFGGFFGGFLGGGLVVDGRQHPTAGGSKVEGFAGQNVADLGFVQDV
jgi:hypothetical protein